MQTGAGGTSEQTDDGSQPDLYVACSRRDANESGDGTLASAGCRKFTFSSDHVDDNPTDDATRGSNVGIIGGEITAYGAVEGGAAVEAVPSKPNQHRANEHQ